MREFTFDFVWSKKGDCGAATELSFSAWLTLHAAGGQYLVILNAIRYITLGEIR